MSVFPHSILNIESLTVLIILLQIHSEYSTAAGARVELSEYSVIWWFEDPDKLTNTDTHLHFFLFFLFRQIVSLLTDNVSLARHRTSHEAVILKVRKHFNKI